MNAPSASGIPLIDLAPLADGGIAGARAIAPSLKTALEEIGFLIITNHGVPKDLIDATFAEARRFHDQSLEDKLAVRMNEDNNGYMAMNRYNVKTSRVSNEEAKYDLNEAFFIKRDYLVAGYNMC